MDIAEKLRAERAKERARTAAMLGLRQQMDACELDGSEARTNQAIEQARQWLEANAAPELDEAARRAILVAAEAAIRERAAKAADAGSAQTH